MWIQVDSEPLGLTGSPGDPGIAPGPWLLRGDRMRLRTRTQQVNSWDLGILNYRYKEVKQVEEY